MARRSKASPLPWARKRKGKRKPNRGLIAVLLSIVTLVLLVVALLAESVLLYTVSALSGLVAVAQVKAAQQEAKREKSRKMPRTPAAQGSAPRATRAQKTAEPTSGAVVKCTQTGKPIDECGCATRHVATADGAKRYGLQVGAPMGRKAKEPKVPTTSRAKPMPPGYAMRRTS